MVDSGQAGYDGPVMNDLLIPDSRHAIFRIGKILARNGLKASGSSLLSECSLENLKSGFLARKLSSAVFFPLVLRESAGGG